METGYQAFKNGPKRRQILKLSVLGAAGEVGRSGFLVNSGTANLLMDYGVMFEKRGEPPKYPIHVKPKDVDAIAITHAHLDHSGGVPSLFVSGNTDVYATPPTMDLSELLIEDMLKIDKTAHPFGQPEVDNMLRNTKNVGYGQSVQCGPISFEMRESGHVLGGSTILAEADGKRLFYTGDIHVSGSRMLNRADLDIGEIDMLVTESTYSQTDQMPRAESEKNLLEFAQTVMDRKGVLFVPAFSVERSQEIACVLKSAKFEHKVYMDGMALKVNEIILKHEEYLRDRDIFSDVMRDFISIRGHKDRKRACEGPAVVISPAGMLVGGNAVFFLQELALNERNGIALVSYQGEGTPGKALLDTGKVHVRGKELKVNAEVKQFQFSGHSDRTELFDMLGKIRGDPKVLTVHGGNDSCAKFAEEIAERFGFDARAAKVNETVTV